MDTVAAIKRAYFPDSAVDMIIKRLNLLDIPDALPDRFMEDRSGTLLLPHDIPISILEIFDTKKMHK